MQVVVFCTPSSCTCHLQEEAAAALATAAAARQSEQQVELKFKAEAKRSVQVGKAHRLLSMEPAGRRAGSGTLLFGMQEACEGLSNLSFLIIPFHLPALL